MAKDTDRCPLCGAVNSYQNVKCESCGEALPWASWVEASRGPSQAIGGQFQREVKRQQQLDVGISLSGGPFMRLMIIVGAIVFSIAIAYFAYNQVSKNIRQVTSGANVNQVKDQWQRQYNTPP